MILLDANVILDVWDPDPTWHKWSSNQMRSLSHLHELAINPIVYAEISVSFPTRDALDERLDELGAIVVSIPCSAAFRAGKAFAQYRRQGGTRANVLPHFFIGAHAAVLGCPLLTQDTRRYAAYFPSVRLIGP
ncbi:MAG: type II toxin-antitoxin system VapC family toxin [Terracidiphilus sp.]|jgi:predicted nucleic acid-binding protein